VFIRDGALHRSGAHLFQRGKFLVRKRHSPSEKGTWFWFLSFCHAIGYVAVRCHNQPVDDVREIPLDCFWASAAFVACHWISSPIHCQNFSFRRLESPSAAAVATKMTKELRKALRRSAPVNEKGKIKYPKTKYV
jgi:hypothetical protein